MTNEKWYLDKLKKFFLYPSFSVRGEEEVSQTMNDLYLWQWSEFLEKEIIAEAERRGSLAAWGEAKAIVENPTNDSGDICRLIDAKLTSLKKV